MAAPPSVNLPTGMPSSSAFKSDCLSSATDLFFHRQFPTPLRLHRSSTTPRCTYADNNAMDSNAVATAFSPNGSALSVTFLFLCFCVCARVILLAAENKECMWISVTVTINFNLFLRWGMGIGIGIHTLVSRSRNWGGIPISCSCCTCEIRFEVIYHIIESFVCKIGI